MTPFFSKRSSILLFTVVMASAIAMVLESSLSYGFTESKQVHRLLALVQAREAADAVLKIKLSDTISLLNAYGIRNDNWSSNPSLSQFVPPDYQTRSTINASKTSTMATFNGVYEQDSITYKIDGAYSPYVENHVSMADAVALTGNISGQVSLPTSTSSSAFWNRDRLRPLLNNNLCKQQRITLGANATADYKSQNLTAESQQSILLRTIPLFSYSVFYDPDLEIYGDTPLQTQGPIHTNGNLYLDGDNSISCYGPVTAAGDIYQRYAWDSNPSSSGNIYLANAATGGITNLPAGMDSTSSDWLSNSYELFRMGAMDKQYHVTPYYLERIRRYQRRNGELENHPYVLIEPFIPGGNPGAKSTENFQKYAIRAGMIFTVNTSGEVTFLKPTTGSNPLSGNRTTCTSALPSGIIGAADATYTSVVADLTMEDFQTDPMNSNAVVSGLYDFQESRELKVLTLDLGRINSVLQDPTAWGSGYTPGINWNGIIYVEFPIVNAPSRGDQIMKGSQPNMVLQIINATDIPSFPNTSNNNVRGTMIVTNAPMYVVGNVNPGRNQPCALVADSITVLSTAWGDTSRQQSKENVYYDGSMRLASDTTVAADIITGTTARPDIGNYDTWNGGLHQLVRFLENWQDSGATFTHYGSLVCLYESELNNTPLSRSPGPSSNYLPCKPPNWNRPGGGSCSTSNTYPPGTLCLNSFRTGYYSAL